MYTLRPTTRWARWEGPSHPKWADSRDAALGAEYEHLFRRTVHLARSSGLTLAALSASAAARIDLSGSFCQTKSHGLAAAWRPCLTTRRDAMADALEQISGLLHEAGETHHRAYGIVDGADAD